MHGRSRTCLVDRSRLLHRFDFDTGSEGEYSFELFRKYNLISGESEALHSYLHSLGLKEIFAGCTKKRQV